MKEPKSDSMAGEFNIVTDGPTFETYELSRTAKNKGRNLVFAGRIKNERFSKHAAVPLIFVFCKGYT